MAESRTCHPKLTRVGDSAIFWDSGTKGNLGMARRMGDPVPLLQAQILHTHTTGTNIMFNNKYRYKYLIYKYFSYKYYFNRYY